MRKWWWVFLLLFSALHADSDTDACRKEIIQIDAEVKKLQAEKQKYEDAAQKYQAEGDRWQYSTGRVQEAYTAWGKANDQRAKAIDLQLQIDHLLERKYRIYQFYPQLQYE